MQRRLVAISSLCIRYRHTGGAVEIRVKKKKPVCVVPGVDCSEEAVAGLALLNELLEAEMNFITSGIKGQCVTHKICPIAPV